MASAAPVRWGARGRQGLTGLGLAMVLLGCGSPAPLKVDDARSPAPLKVDASASPDNCCLLSFVVMDVAADPKLGPVNKASGEPLTWPQGFTARWSGSEIEVQNQYGRTVLRTGARYWLSPLYPPYERFVVGEVRPCSDCALGGGPL